MEKVRPTDFNWDIRARQSIAGGALTNSKRPETFVKGVYPTHLKYGIGPFVVDSHGQRFLDFVCGLGSSILGYANQEVNNAMIGQISKGATLSLSTELEVQAAEVIKGTFPFIQKLRFLKTGSDACTAAVRIARAFTGKSTVFSEGYHGWHDDFVSLTPPATGVVGIHDMKQLVTLNQIDGGAAAVIVEPISTDYSAERIEWLRALKRKCNETKTLLIFDEVITGCRFPSFSVSKYYGIEPDLLCLGKAISNGMPLSVVGGRAEVMETPDYFVSSTFAGETVSLAAMIETIRLLKSKYAIEELWIQGKSFQEQFNSYAPGVLTIEGYPTRGVFKGEPLTKALFMQEACLAGIIFGPSWFFNFSHIQFKDTVLSTCKDIITRIKSGSVQLHGEMPASPFAMKVRNQ